MQCHSPNDHDATPKTIATKKVQSVISNDLFVNMLKLKIDEAYVHIYVNILYIYTHTHTHTHMYTIFDLYCIQTHSKQ